MDIDSKILTDLKENLYSSKIFLLQITFLSIAVLILFSIYCDFKLYSFFTALALILLFDILLLNQLGKIRKREIGVIKYNIKSIRKNKFASPDEIKLGKYLIELEGDIKAMFMRTQNDIANLKKLEHVRTEFLGNVSHELRTPIFAMQGYLETLLGGAINDPRVNKSFLEKAILHTEGLNNLLNDLIDISMIESGQMRMSFRYFNVKQFLDEIVHELKPQAEKKGLELNLLDMRQNLKLFGDKERLKQVVLNLITNSIKYTESGKIEIEVQEENKHGIITVRDTGVGIEEEDLDRIFERFYRVDKDRSKAIGGTGLGLAIVKHILEAHRSGIEVKSQPGVGSEFSFRLKR